LLKGEIGADFLFSLGLHFFLALLAMLVAVRWPRLGSGFGLPTATTTVTGMAFLAIFGAFPYMIYS
jgi:hypothetical protein